MAPGIGDFLKGLLGSGDGGGDAASGEATEYKGFTIRPACRKQGSQWLTAGVIARQIEDEVKEHHFVRADTYGSKDDADACAIVKAKRIIDEQGDAMFKDG